MTKNWKRCRKFNFLDQNPPCCSNYMYNKLSRNLSRTEASASSFSVLCYDGLSLVQSQLVGDFYPTCVKLGAQGRKSFDPKLSCVISEMDIDNRYRRTYFSEIRIGIMGIRIQDLR